MKDRETQLAFIKARAEGKSYSTIAKELGISKATCTSWERQLREEVEELEREQLDELYTAYHMKRDARIKDLGSTVQSIDTALEGKDLNELTVDRLLDLKLRYLKELKAEYVEPVEVATDGTLDGLVEQYDRLFRDSKAGKYSPADVKAQLAILDSKRATLLKAEEERQKEHVDPIIEAMDLSDPYTSGLLRRDTDA